MKVVIDIDLRQKQAKALLEYLKTLDYIKIEVPKTSKKETLLEKSIKEAKAGKTTRIDGTDPLSKMLNIKVK